LRGSMTGPYTGSSLQFLNNSSLFTFDIDTSGQSLFGFTVGASGLIGSYQTQYSLNSFSSFKIRNGLAYAAAGGVANPATTPVTQLGVFLNPQDESANSPYAYYSTLGQLTEPDTSLGLSFFAVPAHPSTGETSATFQAFEQNSYLAAQTMTLPAIGPSSTSGDLPLIDLQRWGQDGLALLTVTGDIAIVRGGFVVPQLLNTNSAAVLNASKSLTHGAGNTLLTLTGSNFIPGVAVTWNGSYRTTTIVDSGHLTVALPASDLAAAGTASLAATNPGAPASSTLKVTIQ
jgi:hypothetical protein